ncbi:MAG: hypothetical protein V7731_17780 [Amphritea sp.]
MFGFAVKETVHSQWISTFSVAWRSIFLGLFVLAMLIASATARSELLPLPPQLSKAQLDITAHFCDTEPRRELCSTLPKDVLEFSKFFIYMLIEQNAQNPFDLFSWQSFIALNWPVDKSGSADIGSSPESPRHWQTYTTPRELFNYPESELCTRKQLSQSSLLSSAYIQADGLPLIDQNGNYVIYDIRINPVMEKYIKQNNLHTLSGQKLFQQAGGIIDFPKGFYQDPINQLGGSVGAMTIKTAWRILDPENDKQLKRFYVTNGLIEVSAEQSLNNKPMCLPVTLGLVGMHIVNRTESGNGGDWIWTTFEHVDNAPFADHARGPNSIHVSTSLFPENCAASVNPENRYSFFDASCEDCQANQPPAGIPEDWKWAGQPPYARYSDNEPVKPPQVTRCWLPSVGTRYINRAWQDKLAGTVWTNYALATTQWKGATKSAVFPNGEVPRYLTNSAFETYLQTADNGTCLGCHSAAKTLTDQPANLTFLLSRARNSESE